jgi:hypothetical protein
MDVNKRFKEEGGEATSKTGGTKIKPERTEFMSN